MPQCGRGCQCAHAQALALELTRTCTELKCMVKYRYWLNVAVEGQTILCLPRCLLCRLMKAIVVMHQETHHSGGIPLCILIITQNALLKTWRAYLVLTYLLCLPQHF